MINRIGVGLSAAMLLTIAPTAWADDPTFAELLSRAHAQAAVGHQWAPAGDNVTETFMIMMNHLSEATPDQLSDFASLLQRQQEMVAEQHETPGAVQHSAGGLDSASSEPSHSSAQQSPPIELPPALNQQPPATDSASVAAQQGTPPAPAISGAQQSTSSEPAPSIAPQNPVVASVPTIKQQSSPSTADSAAAADEASPAPTASASIPDAQSRTANPLPAPGSDATSPKPAAPDPGKLDVASIERRIPDSSAPPASSSSAPAPEPAPAPTAAVKPPEPPVPVRSAAVATPPQSSPLSSLSPSLSPAAPAAPAVPKLAPELIRQMFGRGQAAENQGDISGARRYYTIAAQNGHAGAAIALARLYDPAWLRGRTFGGIDPDPKAVEYWRSRAAELQNTNTVGNSKELSAR